MRNLKKLFVFLLTVLSYSLFQVEVRAIQNMNKPEEIISLEEITIIQLRSVWNLTHVTYALYETNSTNRIKKFWNSMKSLLSVVTNLIRGMDRRIVQSQPSRLLNKLFQLQELETLKEVSDTPTDDPIVHWKVKWIELSSLATHIHWLFNKRMRDIMNNVPYIKTIANSLAKYYGNPWYSKVSGRKNDAHRFPMRDYPRWIDVRIESVPAGNLFFGLRKLIDDCKVCRSGSSVRKDACLGNETLELIEPVRLDAPIYVFFYLCLVDIKFYILKNFFHIYREAYENIPYQEYTIFDSRLQARLRKKLKTYLDAFKDYDTQEQLLHKVVRGYFHCDPLPFQPKDNQRGHVYRKTFIKLTNFATDFVALERDLTPLGTCSTTCKEIGKANIESCNKSQEECISELYPECASNPRVCELFKPICPVEDLICYKSATSAKVCPSSVPDRYMEWVVFNTTSIYPKGANTTCSKRTVQYNSTSVKNPVTGELESCEVCLCQCLEPIDIRGNLESIRIFSQQEVLALLDQNRVVVGVKFEEVKNQIHLMIADAVILPDFKVDMSTVIWRKPKPADPEKPEEVARISRSLRAIHIDDWEAPIGFVVTGIRFVSKAVGIMGQKDYQAYIGVKLKVTKVDEVTGLLIPAESQWIMNSPVTKSTYVYSVPDDPVTANGPAIPDSATNQLIYFRTTAISKTNVNEVIPYFDAQEVIKLDNPSALKGLGIFHKVKPGFGGFLGIKIVQY